MVTKPSSALVFGQVAEWLMAADCKSADPWIYGGSNPPLSTSSMQVVKDEAVGGTGRDGVVGIFGDAHLE